MTQQRNLVSLVRSVLNGDLGVQAALEEIARLRPRVMTDEDWGEEELEFVAQLAEAASEVESESSHLRVYDGGRVVAEAAKGISSRSDGLISYRIGRRLMNLEEPRFALESLKRAEVLLRDGRDELALMAGTDLMRAFERCGRWSELAETAQRLADMARESKHPEYLPRALQRQAQALRHLGRLDDARRLVEEAIEAFGQGTASASNAQIDEFELFDTLGEIARVSGDFGAALAAFEKAREGARAKGLHRAAAYALSEIGITWQHAGDSVRAAEVLRRAQEEAALVKDWRAIIRWGGTAPSEVDVGELQGGNLLAYAVSLLNGESPDYKRILTLTLRCVADAKRSALGEVEAVARNALAAVYEAMGNTNQAIAAADAAILKAQELDSRSLELVFRLNRVRLLIQLGYVPRAEEEIALAFKLGDGLLEDAQTSEVRQTIEGHLARACEYGVICASRQWKRIEGEGGQEPDPDRWLSVTQRGQSLNLANWIGLENAVERTRDGEFAEAVKKLRGVEITIERIAGQSGALSDLLKEQRRRNLQLQQVADRRSVDMSVRPILTRAEIEAALTPNSAVICLYPLFDEVSFVACRHEAESLCGTIPWPAAARSAFINRWEASHAAARNALVAGSDDPCAWRLISDQMETGGMKETARGQPESLTALLDELRERLFDPLRERIGPARAKRLVFIPHVDLSTLPYWAWDRADEDPTVVSLLPSVACLRLLAERHRQVTGSWIKFGDVTGKLRMVQRELQALPRHRELQPTLDIAREGLQSCNLAHFAGHGCFNPLYPYDSGLFFGRPHGTLSDLLLPDPFGLGCSILTVSAIVSEVILPNCYLATLSACCTGIPRRHAASEFTSLPAALMIVGARNVLASIWPAHDGATALLMDEFYRDLPAEGGRWSPSASLARARRVVEQMPRAQVVERLGASGPVPDGDPPFASPLFTMAFQHYGID